MTQDAAATIINALHQQQPLDPETTIETIYDLLNKTESNVVWEILRQCGKFIQWEHYPKDDVIDRSTQSQYYFHAHSPSENRPPEYGHFHLFIRTDGIPQHMNPAVFDNDPIKPEDKNKTCHLIAISMNKDGYPTRLFTTNRWVTDETWYHAEDVCQLVDQFAINHSWPSWPTNLWLTAMVKWFAPEIKQLIRQRDEIMAHWQKELPDNYIYDNHQLEVLSYMDVEIEA